MSYMRTLTLRLLLNPEQASLAKQHADASRACYNWALAESMKEFEETSKRPSQAELGRRLTVLRNGENPLWWSLLARPMLTATIADLMQAYQRFFRVQKEGAKFTEKTKAKAKRQNRKLTFYDMKGHPKFKKRDNGHLSFYGCAPEALRIRKDTIRILRVGRVKFRCSEEIPKEAKLSNPRVVYVNGKWLLKLGVTFSKQKIKLNDFSVGIDLGIKSLAVVSYDNGKQLVFHNVNKEKRVKKLGRRLKRLQRKLSKRVKGSKRYAKTKAKIAEKCFKLSKIRQDHVHKATRKIVNLLPTRIVIEDLNVKGMLKNQYLAKSIQNQQFHEFRRQIEYKSDWLGIKVTLADRFYPSSKTCSNCGSYKKNLKLKDRTYHCENCSCSLDRDFNAARNLEKLGES